MAKKPMVKNRPTPADGWFFAVRIILLCFLFLRFFVDGITYPVFDVFWNGIFFVLLVIEVVRNRLDTRLSYAETALLAFLAVAAVSAGIARVRFSGVPFTTQIFGYFAFFFLLSRAFRAEENRQIWLVLAAAFMFVCCYGLYQHFWGFEETRRFVYAQPGWRERFPVTFIERMESNRIFSTFVYPNVFANFIVTLVPVFFFGGLAFGKRYILPAVLLVAVGIWALLLTGSVGGLFIALFLVEGIALFLLLPRKWFSPAIAAVFVLETVLVLFLYQNGILLHFHSFRDRIQYWQTSLRIIQQFPLLGVGPENFRIWYLTAKPPGTMEAMHAHSILFETLVETGIIGTVALAAFFVFSVRTFFIRGGIKPASSMKSGETGNKGPKINDALMFMNSSGKRLLLAGIGFGLFAGLFHNMSDFSFSDPSAAVLLFLLSGWAIFSEKTDGEASGMRLTKTASCLIILLGFAVQIAAFRFTASQRILQEAGKADSFESALSSFERAERAYPSFEVYYRQGEVLFFAADVLKNPSYLLTAEEKYRLALACNPFSTKTLLRLAGIYEMTGRNYLAVAMYDRLLSAYPAKKEYRLATAVFYLKTGDRKKFQEYYTEANRLPSVSKEEEQAVQQYEQWIASQKSK